MRFSIGSCKLAVMTILNIMKQDPKKRDSY